MRDAMFMQYLEQLYFLYFLEKCQSDGTARSVVFVRRISVCSNHSQSVQKSAGMRVTLIRARTIFAHLLEYQPLTGVLLRM